MLSNRLIHTAVAFFVIGVALGTAMGATQDFRFVHVHAHLNLLGWVALALIGLIYRLHPHLQQGWLAHAHYWLHTVGLVVFMGAFAWGVATGAKPVPFIAAGATMVSLAVLLFAANVFTRLRNNTATNYR
jgi:cbb3-type cytochrome oxidase subunit 1